MSWQTKKLIIETTDQVTASIALVEDQSAKEALRRLLGLVLLVHKNACDGEFDARMLGGHDGR